MGNSANGQAFGNEHLCDVVRGGFPFDSGVCCQDDFAECAIRHPTQQLGNADGLRPQAIERRQMSLEHEVTPTKAGLLDRKHVDRALHHA